MPEWLTGALAGSASAVAILAFILNRIDARMNEKVELGVQAVVNDVTAIEAKLENGILARLDDHGTKLDTVADRLARLEGRLDGILQLVEQRLQ